MKNFIKDVTKVHIDSMKLLRKDFQIWKKEIYLLPTIKVCINNYVYTNRNLALEIHFLVFNARLLWLEDNVEK